MCVCLCKCVRIEQVPNLHVVFDGQEHMLANLACTFLQYFCIVIAAVAMTNPRKYAFKSFQLPD